MMNLKQILKKPLNQFPIKIAIIILVVALIGFADATYLSVKHFQGVIPPCTTDGCETVLTSSYSVIAGIPVALFGAIYYMIIAIGMFAYIDSKKTFIAKSVLILTPIGFIASLWFVFLQLFVIGAICQYCILSAITSITLFVFAYKVLKKNYVESN